MAVSLTAAYFKRHILTNMPEGRVAVVLDQFATTLDDMGAWSIHGEHQGDDRYVFHRRLDLLEV
jgi:hypothetical protein